MHPGYVRDTLHVAAPRDSNRDVWEPARCAAFIEGLGLQYGGAGSSCKDGDQSILVSSEITKEWFSMANLAA